MAASSYEKSLGVSSASPFTAAPRSQAVNRGAEGGAEGVDMFQNILSFHSLLSSP